MNQSTENVCNDIAFCHLPENLEITMEKKLMDTVTKTGIDATKTTSKRVVQKTAEATGDIVGNKIADKITSVDKSKNKQKEKKDETNEVEQIYILSEKRQQIIDDLRLF